MIKKWVSLAVVTVMSTVLLTACTDNEQIKATVEQSLAKQKEIKSYQFTGSLGLQLSDSLLSSPQPLTNGLLSLVRDSTLHWNGSVQTDPMQFEADLKLTPKGASAGIEIPALIKDNKLYFNMPVISKPDEFYVIDMAEMSQGSQSPLTPDSLKNTSQVTHVLTTLFFSDIDAKWLEQSKEPVTLKDGTSAKTITLEIIKKNEKELTTLFQSKLPELIDALQANGFIQAAQAEAWKNGPLKSLQLTAPGKLTLTIDEQGFIRDQLVDLTFSVISASGNVSSNHITLQQAADGLNQTLTFSKTIPEKVKSFKDVLKLLGNPLQSSK
jgi:hypothetical protein